MSDLIHLHKRDMCVVSSALPKWKKTIFYNVACTMRRNEDVCEADDGI